METLTQLGIGGIFAIIVLREVFAFLKNHRNNKDTEIITRKEFNRHKNSVQYKDNCGEIVKRFDGMFDSHNESANERHRELIEMLKELK